jgi:vitamin B12 transporter
MRSLVLLSAFAASLGAQQSPSDSTVLPATIITATRIPTAADAQTSTVTVLEGAVLRTEGLTHVGDALRRVPGIAMARTSSFGSQYTVFMRGGQGNYVRVLVDGVPLNEPGGTLDLGRLTLDDVERIEVVRGPASVLYGSEAVTGVIQIFTRSGGGPTRLRSELGAGSFNALRGSLGGSGSVGALGWSLQADRHTTDGVLAFNNAYRNDGISGALTYALDAKTDVRLTTRYNSSMYQYPTGSAGALEDRNAERTENRLMAGVDLGRKWTSRLESRAQYTAMDLLPRTSDGPDTPGDTLGFFGYFAQGAVKRRLLDTRTTARFGNAQFITVGAEWSRDQERTSSVSLSEFGDFPDALRAARENRALYAQAHGERGALTYTLGGRVDENSAFGSFQTMRLGAGWRLSSALRLRASAGNAFKAPNFFENFAGGFTVGNRDLRPETSRSADFGLEFTLPRGAALQLTGFTQRFQNLIQYNGAVPFGDPNYENIAAANAGGVEAEATLPSVLGIVTVVGHTWTDTRVARAGFDTTATANFVSGGRLLRRPEHVTTVQMRRTFSGLGTFTAAVVRTGDREDRNFATWPAAIVVLDPFTTVDLSADLRLPSRGATAPRLIIRAENVGNVRFEQIAGFASPGRILYAGLRLER